MNITELRKKLNLSQAEFGNLFGVHAMTVSKWERGLLQPNSYQMALMDEFLKAAQKKETKEMIGKVLIGAGVAAALFMLLKNAKE